MSDYQNIITQLTKQQIMNKQRSNSRINSKSERAHSVQNNITIHGKGRSKQKLCSLVFTKSNNNLITASQTHYRGAQEEQQKQTGYRNDASGKQSNNGSLQKIRQFDIESCTPKKIQGREIELNLSPLKEKQKSQQIIQQLSSVYQINKKYIHLLSYMIESELKAAPQPNSQQLQNFNNIKVSSQKAVSLPVFQSKNENMSERQLILHRKLISLFQQNLQIRQKLLMQTTLRQQCYKLRQYIKNKVDSQQFQSSEIKNQARIEYDASKWTRIYRQLFLNFMNKQKQLQRLNSQVSKYKALSRQVQEYQQKYKESRRSCSPKQLKQLSKSQYDRLQRLERRISKQKKRNQQTTKRNTEMIQQLQQIQKKLKQSQKLKNNIQIKFIDLNRQIQYCRSKSKKYSKIINEKQKQQIKALNRITSMKKVGTKISK